MGNGGARPNAGRKKGIGITFDIKNHCEKFIRELLNDEAIRKKATKQLSLAIDRDPNHGYIYIMKSNNLYKIGYTSDIIKRKNNYKSHGTIELVYCCESINAFRIEEMAHNEFKNNLAFGAEWYSFSPFELISVITYLTNQIFSNGRS